LPRLSLLILAVASLSASLIAQSSDRVEVFGGYTYMDPDFSLVSPNSTSGWNASANFKPSRWVGIVADFSGFYSGYTYPPGGTNDRVTGQAYTFLFGPQVSLPLGRFSPFARFLTGLTHVTPQDFGGQSENFFKSSNAFTIGAGGGADYYFLRHVGLRGQVDWLYAKLTPVGGGDPGANYIKNRNVARISTGVIFRF
jgi:opacity protein-like surface antigen